MRRKIVCTDNLNSTFESRISEVLVPVLNSLQVFGFIEIVSGESRRKNCLYRQFEKGFLCR